MRQKIPHPSGGFMEICYCRNCLRGRYDQCLYLENTDKEAPTVAQEIVSNSSLPNGQIKGDGF
ncbi:hypothetical protein KKH39_04340 [Patescibacteria group bacterium]|nr:hypothetical protein [Patescibacteria group bacterium]